MKVLHAVVALIAMGLAATGDVCAQDPLPPREPSGTIDAASALFDAGRWDEAAAAFEAAARGGLALPPPALRRWGIAAFESGRPLTAYVRLRQYLALDRVAPDRDALLDRIGRARDLLIPTASRFSRLSASLERRPDADAPGERAVVRMAARDGEVSLEALTGPRVETPTWRRAEEIPLGPYLEFVRRVLEWPSLAGEFPVQAFDANEPGPRRAVTVRLVVGDEEWRVEALRDEPYQRLQPVVDMALDFARRVPAVVESEPTTPPVPPKPPLRKAPAAAPKRKP